MLGNVLSGEISDMILALKDYRLDTMWKGQLAMRLHTINYRLILAIQTYMTQNAHGCPTQQRAPEVWSLGT